jgi:hypothetical protein
MDLVMVALVFAFFVLSQGFIAACERLRRGRQ